MRAKKTAMIQLRLTGAERDLLDRAVAAGTTARDRKISRFVRNAFLKEARSVLGITEPGSPEAHEEVAREIAAMTKG